MGNNSSAHLLGCLDASLFFENLCATNNLANAENFLFCRVSGLEGFEEALAQMQTTSAFCCVSDIADGYTELNNTPRTRRVNRFPRHAPRSRRYVGSFGVYGNYARVVPTIHVETHPRKGQIRAELHLYRPSNIVQRD